MPVTPEQTAAALEDSIQQWDENARAEKPEDAVIDFDDCALCDLFWDDDCDGCPVKNRTGDVMCHGSPYDEASAAFIRWALNEETAEAFHAAAAKMRDFLISLRVKA